MARQYKKNRARGTRKTTYNIKQTYTGGFIVLKRGNYKSNKAYTEAMIQKNIDVLADFYNRQKAQAYKIGQEAAFLKQNPNVQTFIKKRIFSGSKKEWKQLIDTQFAFAAARVAKSLMTDLINFNKLADLAAILNTQITLDLLEEAKYIGNGIYHLAFNGIVAVIDFRNSPKSLEVYSE